MTNNTAPAGRAPYLSVQDLVYIGIFAALTVICSWISIPTVIPFTLQTFAVFLSCLVLGGRRSVFVVLVYILLGAVGLPVFSGFKSGAGVLLGSTGGYILGFIATALIVRLLEPVCKGRVIPTALSLMLGLLVCYALGTAWFMFVYGRTNGAVGVMTTLGWCVFPFIIPDLVKLFLALTVSRLLQGAGIFRK